MQNLAFGCGRLQMTTCGPSAIVTALKTTPHSTGNPETARPSSGEAPVQMHQRRQGNGKILPKCTGVRAVLGYLLSGVGRGIRYGYKGELRRFKEQDEERGRGRERIDARGVYLWRPAFDFSNEASNGFFFFCLFVFGVFNFATCHRSRTLTER